MRPLLPATISLLLVFALAACGDDDDETSGSSPTPLAQASPAEVIADSVQSFEAVDTFSGTYEITSEVLGIPFTSDGEVRYRSPDVTYFTLSSPLTPADEALLIGNTLYLREGDQWTELDTAPTGIDFAALYAYANNAGPFSYEQLAANITDLEALPNETIDGQTYLHIRGEVPAERIEEVVPDGVVDPAVLSEAATNLKRAEVDLLIALDSLLPRSITTVIETEVQGNPLSLDLTLEVTEYNEDVDVPEPPEDIRPLPVPTPRP